MRVKSEQNLGKTLSYFLRHNPKLIGGLAESWARTTNVIDQLNISEAMLLKVVTSDSKHRFEFNPDHSMIRARYGHSVPTELQLHPTTPPVFLWHGTVERSSSSILSHGLLPQSRQFAHLSEKKSEALKVGQRHGSDVVLIRVAALWANIEDLEFYNAGKGVWLAKYVLPKYLTKVKCRERVSFAQRILHYI